MFITILAYIKTLSIIVVFFFYINLLRPLTKNLYSLVRDIMSCFIIIIYFFILIYMYITDIIGFTLYWKAYLLYEINFGIYDNVSHVFTFL